MDGEIIAEMSARDDKLIARRQLSLLDPRSGTGQCRSLVDHVTDKSDFLFF